MGRVSIQRGIDGMLIGLGSGTIVGALVSKRRVFGAI